MNVCDAIKQRRSVRAYSEKPVAKELIEQIFTDAQNSPSNCNTQPWHVTVVSGDARDKLEKAMVAEIMSGKAPTPHFKPGDQGLKDDYRKRQIACAISLYDAMDIKYEEKDKRQQLMLRNWQFFGAPQDMGIYLQTVMLLMTENGLSSCPQGALAMYPDPVYEIANIPDGCAIMFGLSFGYAEENTAINSFDVGREDLAKAVEFLS